MNYNQSPHTILMVRPTAFGYNEQTASSNAFQQTKVGLDDQEIQNQAVAEFDAMVDKLKTNNIPVMVIEDTLEPITPDAVFPNNWISMQPDGKVILYPMEAANRRRERRSDIVEVIKEQFEVSTVMDISHHEEEARFLEGTGSIVFDHINKFAFANYSSRTNEELLEQVCEAIGYKPIGFHAHDKDGKDIYHTNVMMCIGTEYALVCFEAVKYDEDLDRVIEALNRSERKIIAISYEQMEAFAGNMLEVQSTSGERFLVMSETAFQSLVNGQINAITECVEIITADIPTIERYGGGGVRCMMAGIHLPK